MGWLQMFLTSLPYRVTISISPSPIGETQAKLKY